MTNSTTINQTIQSALNGNQNAYTALFNTLKPMVQSICARMLKGKSTDVIEDAILISMAKVFKNLETYDNSSYCLSTWVGKITQNQCIDTLRAKNNSSLSIDELISKENGLTFAEHLTDNSMNAEQILISNEYVSSANSKINTLQGNYKVAVDMRRDGKTYNEIAELLNVPIGTVKNLVHRATKKLQAN